MFLSTDSVLYTLQSTLPGTPVKQQEVSNKRAASVSTACLLGLTACQAACKALQSGSWLLRFGGTLLLIELGFFLWQRHR